jgi:hypothetical protein
MLAALDPVRRAGGEAPESERLAEVAPLVGIVAAALILLPAGA